MVGNFYRGLVRPMLFRLDSERAHHLALAAARVGAFGPLRRTLRPAFDFEDARLRQTVFGREFPNPVGLAAGFDKECAAVPFFQTLGFGFVEIGTVTARAQPGNPRPRIFRLADDAALINRMGFPSSGAEVVRPRLEAIRNSHSPGIIGINIGKTKDVGLDDALDDYLASFRALNPFADYCVVNVSSPNTPELRKLQERDRLEQLLKGLQSNNTVKNPLLVKVAPDLTLPELDELLEICGACDVAAIIATNTTLSRDGLSRTTAEQGGLSGKPLFEKSRTMVRHIYRSTNGALPIIGVGGIFGAGEALEMIRSGATLIQIYTGLVYEGPLLVKRIKRELCEKLDQEGIAHIRDLIGVGVKT